MKTYKVYHETLGHAIQEVESISKQSGVISKELDSAVWGVLGYDEDLRKSFIIDEYNGRRTRKGLQVQIWRFRSGTYELNMYIL